MIIWKIIFYLLAAAAVFLSAIIYLTVLVNYRESIVAELKRKEEAAKKRELAKTKYPRETPVEEQIEPFKDKE